MRRVVSTITLPISLAGGTSGGGGGGGLPAGVSLLAIDGETISGGVQTNSYYSGNGWTSAANIACNGLTGGWDNPAFFPVGLFLSSITNSADATQQTKLFYNTMFMCQSTTDLTVLRSNNISLIQGLSADPGPPFFGWGTGNSAQAAAAGTETVGVCVGNDEPTDWNNAAGSPSSKDIVNNAAGTESGHITIPANFERNRFFWCNFTGNIYTGALSGTPNTSGTGAGAPWNVMNTSFLSKDGDTRFIATTGADYYWMSFEGGHSPFDASKNYNLIGNSGNLIAAQTSGTTPPFTVQAGLYFQIGATVSLSTGAGGGITINGTLASYNFSTGSTTILTDATGSGSGSTSSGWVLSYHLTAAQWRIGTHYGDFIDPFRGFQYGTRSAPIMGVLETGGPFSFDTTQASYIQPPEFNAAAWAQIMHGARALILFDVTPVGPGAGGTVVQESAYFISPQGSQTLSIWDQIRATSWFIKQLAPVINSPFAIQGTVPTHTSYASVSPGGANSVAPWPGSYRQNQNVTGVINSSTLLYTTENWQNTDIGPNFEVMSKWYQGSTTGFFTQNRAWIFAAYRGLATDTSIGATFTIPNDGRTSVTRFYNDAVIGAASNGAGGTRITVGNVAQMVNGDTAIISNCAAGWTIGGSSPNTTFTNIFNVGSGGATFDVTGAFSGTFTAHTSNGVVITTHDIAVTGGTTFTDTFASARDIHIYRVN